MYGNLVDRLKADSLDIKALEIYFMGETVFHYVFGNNQRYPVYSITTSVTSAAFSLACSDGLMTAEIPLAEFLPTRDKNNMSRDFINMPIRRFLTMTAGEYPFRPFGDNWLKTSLSLNIDFSDATFHYSNIPAYFVSAALENALGEPLITYLNRRLFEPLGIPEPPHSISPEGYFYGATGMSLSVSELAILGKLYLQKGLWNCENIIPSKYINEAITPYVLTNKSDSYGYFFRVGDDHFSMVGKWGQRCIVYPKYSLVIAYLSHQPERSEELYCKINNFAHLITAPNTSQ